MRFEILVCGERSPAESAVQWWHFELPVLHFPLVSLAGEVVYVYGSRRESQLASCAPGVVVRHVDVQGGGCEASPLTNIACDAAIRGLVCRQISRGWHVLSACRACVLVVYVSFVFRERFFPVEELIANIASCVAVLVGR